jgi:C_GCAxxG_C_C family probable redox protein
MKKEEKKELAEEAYQAAYTYDIEYGCCPQCVLAAIQDTVDVGITDEIVTAAHALAGGGGLLTQGTCGALNGGLMAIAAKHGRPPDDFGVKRHLKSYKLGKDLVEWFKERYGGLTCTHIQQKYTDRTWDLWDAEDFKAFHESPCHVECAKITGEVARWCVEHL